MEPGGGDQGRWRWVLSDEPLLHADSESIRFGPFSGSINVTCGCDRAVIAKEMIQKKKKTKRYFKRTK